MTTAWDVIVVGAGPAGSVAARQIALTGRRVLLLDKKRFPRRKVCGACLNAAAVSQLSELGLGHVLRDAQAIELTRFDLRFGSRRLSLSLPNSRVISRAHLDQRLVDEAVRVGVEFQDEVSASVGPIENESRIVFCRRANEASSSTHRAKLVLAADGLGHPSLNGMSEINDVVANSVRVGAGCEVTRFPAEFEAGVIHMAVGRDGYVGSVQIESGLLNVAASFDPNFLREAGSPANAAQRVLAEAGFAAIPALAEAEWLGTPPLTRRPSSVAAERLFLLGDAAGYIEPFTGEGIGWALSSAVAIAPLASEATNGWRPELEAVWVREHRRLIYGRQRTCRLLASLLKHPSCVRAAMSLLTLMPWLSQRIVNGISTPLSGQFNLNRSPGRVLT